MTTVTFIRQGRRMEVSARGHASGAPVVCGIISAVLQGLATTLRGGELFHLDVGDLRVSLRPGFARISCRGDEDTWKLFVLCRVTLLQVALAQPAALVVE